MAKSANNATTPPRENPAATTTTATFRLLLHAVDGVIPYMTPLLLNKYFPPSRPHHLILGIAVRDTSITAIYPTTRDLDHVSKKKKRKVDFTKPCGYTFEATPIDGFLQRYETFVVPSFDLYQDVLKNEMNHEKKAAAVTVSNKQVMVWTPHGRNGLTPELYTKATSGFQNNNASSVSLYDMALDSDSTKRKQTALQRNQTWLEYHVKQHPNKEEQNRIWAPVLLAKDNANDNNLEQQLNFINDKDMLPSIAGIAVIGWCHVNDRVDRNKRLQTLMQYNQKHLEVAVLATRSTLQILDAMRLGVCVIGTELPTLWAKKKRALGLNWELTKNDATLDHDGCIDLQDASFVRDSLPLVPGCTCLACRDNNSSSRAYIHHLVQAKEILAEILLFGHNLHQLLELCRHGTEASKQKRLDDFCDGIEKQLPQDSTETDETKAPGP